MATELEQACLRYRNWGKWGADDELGTLNYITPRKIDLPPSFVPRFK